LTKGNTSCVSVRAHRRYTSLSSALVEEVSLWFAFTADHAELTRSARASGME
jgi:hypothetical protein